MIALSRPLYLHICQLEYCVMITSLVRQNDAVPSFWCTTGVRADSRFAPSQWETSLQSNAVSHWLGANLESAQWYYCTMFWLEWGRRYSSQKCTASQICLVQPARDTTKTHSSRGTVMLLSSYTYRWHSQQRRNYSALAMELLSFALSHGFDYHAVCIWYTSNILALFQLKSTPSAHGYAGDALTLMPVVIGSAQCPIFDIGRRRSNIVPIDAVI